MKSTIKHFYIFSLIISFSCGSSPDSYRDEKKDEQPITNNTAAISNENQRAGEIVGEWEQQYTCFDRNGNRKLEPEEKKASGTHLGFDWFKFNADGSCLWDKDIQFKGTYEIQNKNDTKKLVIQGGDKFRYTLDELTDKEFILGSDGAFIVFKRIK